MHFLVVNEVIQGVKSVLIGDFNCAGKQLVVRPILEGFPDAHLWSIGGSDGAHSVRLDTLDEGQTRLLACAPASPSQPGKHRPLRSANMRH